MVGSSQTDLPSVTDPRTWESTHRLLSPIRPHGLTESNLLRFWLRTDEMAPPLVEGTGRARWNLCGNCAFLGASRSLKRHCRAASCSNWPRFLSGCSVRHCLIG